MKRLWHNFYNFTGKIKENLEVFEKVETQKALNAAFRRKVMADYLQIFNLNSQAFKRRDSNERGKDHSVSSSNFNMPAGTRKCNAYRKGSFQRNHSKGSSGIYRQFANRTHGMVNQLSLAKYNSVFNIKGVFVHTAGVFAGLKRCCITLGESVFRVFHKSKPFPVFGRQQFLVNFIPVRAVADKPAGDRSGSGFVHLIYLNQQPLAVESFFDSFNFFSFHNNHLNKNNNTERLGSQGEYDDGSLTAYDVALALQLGKGELEAAGIGQQAVGLL